MFDWKQSVNRDNEHPVIALYDAYEDGALSAADAAAYRQHLAGCHGCQTWVANQVHLGRQLRSEAAPSATLAPDDIARIQQNVFKKMRRALIMHSLRNATGAVIAAAVLVLIVGVFLWQSRTLSTVGIFDQTAPELNSAAEPAQDITVAQEAEDGSAAVAGTTAQLFTAVETGDATQIEALLADGADPNAPDADGNALLALAARNGELEIARLLIAAGADVDGVMAKGLPPDEGVAQTALMEAVGNNDLEMARLLIANGADVDYGEKRYDVSPLLWAADADYVDMVALLLENGADPNRKSEVVQGESALLWALQEDAVASAEALLDAGADPNIKDNNGWTTLISLLVTGRDPKQFADAAQLLLSRGADPDAQDNVGNTALHYAARENKPYAIPILLAHGASVDVQNNAGETPLDVASTDAIRELFGAVQYSDDLAQAVASGDIAAAREILDDGAHPNLPDSSGNYPLALAAKNDELEIAQILLDAGADPDSTVAVGSTPYAGANVTALGEAAHHNNLELAQLLLNNGADPNQQETHFGLTPLERAAGFNYVDMVNLLLENGGDPDLALPTAVHEGAPGAVSALIAGGADVNLRDEDDLELTPLLEALLRLDNPAMVEQMVTILLEEGADPNLADNIGNTPLHYAALFNRPGAIPLLLQAGAAPDKTNAGGKTPLDVAVNDEVKQLLQQ